MTQHEDIAVDHQILPEEWDRRFRAIWGTLEHLLKRSGAATAVLLDTAGNAVTYSGKDPDFDLLAFAPLAAGDFLATRELAAVLGEDSMDWVAHQGRRRGVFLSSLHSSLILAVIFDRRSSLGLVRYEVDHNREAMQEATAALARLLDRQLRFEADAEDDGPAPPRDERDEAWIEQQLDQLFGPQA